MPSNPCQAGRKLKAQIRLQPDIVLLAEMDNGMVRSGNRHTTRVLAGLLGMSYVFGVEYLELGLGDERERKAHLGQQNALGLHGAGLVAVGPIEAPAIVRLDQTGSGFPAEADERRVGGRIAVAGTVKVGGEAVCCVSVHFESRGGPADRAAEMAVLVEAVDALADGRPVVIGGDFNTNMLATNEVPRRIADAAVREPLFDVAAAAGYDLIGCNAPGPTTRTRRDGTPWPPTVKKLDWFFTRGVEVSDPAIVPAIDDAEEAISDHELLIVDVRPRP